MGMTAIQYGEERSRKSWGCAAHTLGRACSFSTDLGKSHLGLQALSVPFLAKCLKCSGGKWRGFSIVLKTPLFHLPLETEAENPWPQPNPWARKEPQGPSNWQYHSIWRTPLMTLWTIKLPTVRKKRTPPLWHNHSLSNKLHIKFQIMCNNTDFHVKRSFNLVPKSFKKNVLLISTFISTRNRHSLGLAITTTTKKKRWGDCNMWCRLYPSPTQLPTPFFQY